MEASTEIKQKKSNKSEGKTREKKVFVFYSLI